MTDMSKDQYDWEKFKEWGCAEYVHTGTVSVDWAQKVIRAALEYPNIMVSIKPFRDGISSITILTVSGPEGEALSQNLEDQLFEFAINLT